MNWDSAPTVTIAIPVYNGAAYLGEAIRSAQAQTVPVVIKVYDNASTDDSLAIARQHLADSAIVMSERNLGGAENFNRAVRDAKTDYFMWLGSDDTIGPTFVETCLRVLERTPAAYACIAGIQYTDSVGRPTRVQTDEGLDSDHAATRLRSFLRRRRWTETYCLYRTERLKRSRLFTKEYAADVLLSWWFLLRGPLAVTTDVLLRYREYPVKTVEATAASLDPHAAPDQWRKRKMWRRMYAMTREAGVPPQVGRVARRELRLAAVHPTWGIHFAEDVLVRWPGMERMARRAWRKAGSPGRLSPTR